MNQNRSSARNHYSLKKRQYCFFKENNWSSFSTTDIFENSFLQENYDIFFRGKYYKHSFRTDLSDLSARWQRSSAVAVWRLWQRLPHLLLQGESSLNDVIKIQPCSIQPWYIKHWCTAMLRTWQISALYRGWGCIGGGGISRLMLYWGSRYIEVVERSNKSI